MLKFIGVPLNKSLYTISYMFLTTGVAGATFCALYVLVSCMYLSMKSENIPLFIYNYCLMHMIKKLYVISLGNPYKF